MSDNPIPESLPVTNAVAKLRAAGLRITQTRVLLVRLLHARLSPVSIDDIYKSIPKDKLFDLVTIYRCLAVFEELGIVRRCFSNNGTALWQLIEEGSSPYFVVSKTTADAEPLDSALTLELKTAMQRVEDILKKRGYTDIAHKVQFFAKKEGSTEQ